MNSIVISRRTAVHRAGKVMSDKDSISCRWPLGWRPACGSCWPWRRADCSLRPRPRPKTNPGRYLLLASFADRRPEFSGRRTAESRGRAGRRYAAGDAVAACADRRSEPNPDDEQPSRTVAADDDMQLVTPSAARADHCLNYPDDELPSRAVSPDDNTPLLAPPAASGKGDSMAQTASREE